MCVPLIPSCRVQTRAHADVLLLSQLFGLRGLATVTGWIVASQSPGQLAGASVSGVVLSSSGEYSHVAYYAGAIMLGGALLILPGAPSSPCPALDVRRADAPLSRHTARFLRRPSLLARY